MPCKRPAAPFSPRRPPASAAVAAGAAARGAAQNPTVARSKIALEEHFITPALLPYFKSGKPALGAGRVMFSIDYPFEVSEVAGKFMDSTKLAEEVRARVAFGNAAALLRIGV